MRWSSAGEQLLGWTANANTLIKGALTTSATSNTRMRASLLRQHPAQT